jgi:hypothetical protein
LEARASSPVQLLVHGGRDKAVYCCPLSHYDFWFSVGSAEVVVTQPRLPCYKLGVKFQMDDMVKRFLASRRTRFYLAVVRADEVGVSPIRMESSGKSLRGDEAGDDIELIERDEYAVPVSAITRSYVAKATMPGVWIALCGLQPCQKVGRVTSANV